MTDTLPDRPPLLLGGIPFEPSTDDLDELRDEFTALPGWPLLAPLFDEVLELAASSRHELERLGVPPLGYFDELRPLVFGMGTFLQHCERRARLGGDDSGMVYGIDMTLSAWECNQVKALDAAGKRAALALAVCARSLKMLVEWDTHHEEADSDILRIGERINLIREALGLPMETDSPAHRVALSLSTARQSDAVRKDRTRIARHGGNRKHKSLEPIRRYAHSQLPGICYDDSDKRLTQAAAIEAIKAKLERRFPSGDIPKWETLQGWLKVWCHELGYTDWRHLPKSLDGWRPALLAKARKPPRKGVSA